MIPSFERRHSAGHHLRAEGQVIAGAVGAVVGFYVGGPSGAQWGYAIGAGLYAVSQPGPHSEGPKLNDLKVTGTDYGQSIPWVAGHPRISGQIIYASQKREIATTTEQGKGGGPSYTNYTYEVDLLFLLTDNEIEDVSRIWDNGKLIYSVLNGSSAETLTASSSTARWNRLSVYGGAQDQLPDPTYEAAVGIGRAPAYRGRGSVFIEGLKLGTSGQLPNLTFEIVKFGNVEPGIEQLDWTKQIGAASIQPPTVGVTAFAEGQYQVHIPRNQLTGPWFTDVFRAERGQELVAVGSYEYPEFTARLYIVRGQVDTSGTYWLSGISGNCVGCIGQFGTQVTYLGVGGGVDTVAFCQRGDYTYFSRYEGGNILIKKYSTLTGGAAIETVVHPANGGSPTIDTNGSIAYVFDESEVHLFSADDLTHMSTIPAPFTALGWIFICCDGNAVYTMNPGETMRIYRLNGTSGWDLVNEFTRMDPSDDGPFQSPWSVVSGNWYRPVFHGEAGDWNTDVWSVLSQTVSPEDETLQSVVEQLLLRAGYEPDEFDVSALASITKPVRSLSVASIGATRATLETLMQAYYFDSVLSDKIYFRPRQETPVATVEWDELGASTSREGDSAPLDIKYRNELEVPAQIALSYVNVGNDYQTGTEFSDRAISSQSSTTAVQIGLGMTPGEAKGIADALVMDNYASLAGTTIKIPFTRNELEPTDIITAFGPVESYRLRLIKKNDSGGILSYDAVIDDVRALLSAQITDEDYEAQTEVLAVATTLWESLDIPLLREADDSPGWYVAAKRNTDGSLWPGASIFQSWDDISYADVATFTSESVFGMAGTVLEDWTGGNVFDEISSVQVDVGAGQLSSSTRTAMLADLTINVMIVGAEVIRFRTATMTAPGVYTLTGLIRGFRGTQWAMTGHAANERVVLLSPSMLQTVAAQASQINVLRYVVGVTFNKPLSSDEPEEFTDTGIRLMPFAPTDLRISRDTSANISSTFKRMTRLSFRFLSPGIDPPLGEAAELYDAVIYSDNTYTTVKRTITVSEQTFSYSAADQTTDFGSTQSTIYVEVFQRSAIVGRGYALRGQG